LRIGAFGGEYRLDEATNIIVDDTVSRPYNSVVSMALDDWGTLWKGCVEGLFAEDREGHDRQITDCMVSFAVNYRNRYVIFGTDDQLHLFDLPAFHRDSTVRIRTFGYYDGFDVMECGQNGASIDRDGYVWVAGSDKAVRFMPDEIMNTPLLQPRPPFLAAIYKAGKSAEWIPPTPAAPSIQLENEERHLRFDLLQASPSAPDKLIFRYRLNGNGDHWLTTRDRSVTFQNLPHGKYRFEVQSSVDDGLLWSESVFSPPLSIKPPFILSLPGLALLFTGFSFVIALCIYFTRKFIIRREKERHKLEHLQLLAIRAKFIPHFTGNVLNSINYLIQKKPQEAQQYLCDFADFSNMTLRNSDFVSRTVKEELNYVKLYLSFEKLRFDDRFAYDISVDDGVNMELSVPCMAIQTFCVNALKHGLANKPDEGRIDIRITLQNGYTVIAVEDDGIGRQKAQQLKTEGTGEGLKIVQQQIDLLNKNKPRKAYMQITDLHTPDGHPSGTRAEVWMPND
jgi:hypothetical protein